MSETATSEPAAPVDAVGQLSTPPRPETATVSTPESPTVSALRALGVLTQVHDRPDLDAAIGGAIGRLRSARLRIVVIGEFKKGKSSLVNALVDAPVSAVDDDIATAARLEVVHSERPGAHWWRRVVDDDGVGQRVDGSIPVDDVRAACTDPSTLLVRAGLPRRLLRSGVTLVDTPGVGGMGSAEAVSTASTLADAHVALFVTDCTQELSAPELHALRDAVERGPQVVLIETKTDISPHWRTIVDADREHLRAAGLRLPVIALSNELRVRALRVDDPELNEESGFNQLVDLIARRFVPDARVIAERGALQTAQRVYALLHRPLAEELDALEAAASDDEIQARIDEATSAVAAFKAKATVWQQQLGDGMADLVSAVDNDLRQRVRDLVQEAEETLADVDPDEVWDEFEPALYRTTAEALDANLTLLREHAHGVAATLTATLDDAAGIDADGLFIGAWDGDADDSLTADRRAADSTSAGARAHQAFRAGYGGAMPIMAVGGMALGVLGLGTLVMPLAAVAGVIAGRKALTDERDRQLAQRRQQARVAIKRYTDDVLLRAVAERKTMQRRVQRTLRDHFTARVKELTASHAATLRSLQAAAEADDAVRRRRAAELRDELGRIEQVGLELRRVFDTASAGGGPQ